jgi:hypothetical protein
MNSVLIPKNQTEISMPVYPGVFNIIALIKSCRIPGFIIMIGICLLFAFFTTGLYGQRDPYKWPFAQNSIWNMPLHADAQYKDARIGIPANGYGVDEDVIILSPDAPSTQIFNNYAGWDRTKSRCPQEGPLLFTAPMPADFIYSPDNWHGLTPNAGLAILMPDGESIRQTQPFARCEAGSYGTSRWAQWPAKSIYGDGIIGAHGGSGMSAIGGTIRLGELVPGGVIRHAMKINIYANKYLYFDKETGGKRWPAPKADGYAADRYGTLGDPEYECRMGALLALKPDLDLTSLNFETGNEGPAMILARAFQTYGAYIVDDTAWDRVDICTEISPGGRVTSEFRNAWGFNFNSGTNTPFGRDLAKIITRLHVVANNAADNIGGGPSTDLVNRRAPVACDFGEPGSGLMCLDTLVIVPVNGVYLSSDSITVPVGQTRKLEPFITPQGATNKSVYWTSNNAEVAIVSDDGIVTALDEGNAKITVTTADGNFSADVVIDVISQYKEDFISGTAEDWVITGNYMVSTGRLSTTHWSAACKGIYNGMTFNSPYTYTVDFLSTGTATGSVTRFIFNYQDDDNYYFLEMTGGTNGTVTLKKKLNGEVSIIDHYGTFNSSNTHIALEITCSVNNISVKAVRGTEQFVLFSNVTDTSFSSGKIGIATSYNNVHFYEITVNYRKSGPATTSNTNSPEKVLIYPNPSGDLSVTIEFPGLTGKKKLEIFSIMGEQVFNQLLDEECFYYRVENYGAIRTGLYLVRITTDKGALVKKLIIK